jgi:hypothetical protein
MTRSECVGSGRLLLRIPWWGKAVLGTAFVAALLGLAGCSHSQQTRAQAEDEADRYQVKTIGDITDVGNAEPVRLGGVGLVTGLEGTGGTNPNDPFRSILEHELLKTRVKNVKELLASPGNAVVAVEAQLPPGTRQGDPLDVVVSLPAGSPATSLRGGYLQKCLLYNYDFTQNLSPNYKGPQGMLQGHPLASAEGAVLVGVGLGDGDEASRLKEGRMWSGGKARVDKPYGLMMKQDKQYASLAGIVSERINETFQAGVRGMTEKKLATFQSNLGVALRVPVQYKLNVPRYLRVVRFIPLRNVADSPGAEGADRRTYRQKLAADLLDPAWTVTAALRLEALGSRSIPVLKAGLESNHPLVRFCSAEALAYLGSPSCAEELARSVLERPLFRSFGLAALASLDEAACQVQLQDILRKAQDDETRMGAFRALNALNARNPLVQGEELNESFWLHRIPTSGDPLVHISSVRRAEIVLFGAEPALKPPFSFLAGEFAITATDEDQRCIVGRFSPRQGPVRKQCSLKIEDILRAMAELGAQYPEVVAVLQQAHSCGSLTGRVRCDALPQATSVHELVKVGRGEMTLDSLPAGADLGETPTLYALGLPSRRTVARSPEAGQRERSDGTLTSPKR